jgi:hypothetical protein
MFDRRYSRRVLIAGALALALAPAPGFGFVESTTTEGVLPVSINGAWLLVSHLEFPRPTPTPAPAPAGTEATVSPTPAPSPAVAEKTAPVRIYNVVNVLKIVHYPKAEAQVLRDRDTKMQQAAIDKAKAIIAAEHKGSVPVETVTGEVEGAGEAKVIVPSIPAKRLPGDGDDVEIYLLDVALPPSIENALQKAQKAERAWTPTAKDLALLKSSWSSLKPSKRDEINKIEWTVRSPDKFDEGLQTDPATKDAKFAITANQDMLPKPGVAKTNILIFGAREIDAGSIKGAHVRAMMAGVPFPITIEMKGPFTMYKLADVPRTPPEKAPAPPQATPAPSPKAKATAAKSKEKNKEKK